MTKLDKQLREAFENLAYAARDALINRQSVTDSGCVNEAMVKVKEIFKCAKKIG